jgi:hypothetical protein
MGYEVQFPTHVLDIEAIIQAEYLLEEDTGQHSIIECSETYR